MIKTCSTLFSFLGAGKRTFGKNSDKSLHRSELILAHTAYRAYPVIGKIGKRRAGFDTVVRIAYRRVIYPVAYFTYIFVHS